MKNKGYSIFVHGKIVAICKAILREEMSIIAGSRTLSSLRYEINCDQDEDFLLFVSIDSETDHLPVDWERRNWSIESLKRKDKEIAGYEMSAKDEVLIACKKLIERFDVKGSI